MSKLWKRHRQRIIIGTLVYLVVTALICTAAIVLDVDWQSVQIWLLPILTLPFNIILACLYFLMAFIVHRLSWKIADGLLNSEFLQTVFVASSDELISDYLKLQPNKFEVRPTHQKTLQYLTASIITLVAFSTATLLSLNIFLKPESVAVFTGLVTAGVGFGARTLIGDLLAGAANMFEDNFNVDEKLEVAFVSGSVEGIVESLTIRTVSIRAPSGELFLIPHGEMRILRNFSRGQYSSTKVKFKIANRHLKRTIETLNALNQEAIQQLPNLLQPWLTLSEEGVLGGNTELTLVCKAKYGKGAELRLNLLALLHEKLTEIGVEVVD